MVTTMKMATGIALFATLVMTSCSGPDTESVGSGQDVADMIGCAGWSNTFAEADGGGGGGDDDAETLAYDAYVKEGGTCELYGQDVGVYYFLDKMARDGFVLEGSELGGDYLIGGGCGGPIAQDLDRWRSPQGCWVIEAPSTVLDQLEAEHGGTRSSG